MVTELLLYDIVNAWSVIPSSRGSILTKPPTYPPVTDSWYTVTVYGMSVFSVHCAVNVSSLSAQVNTESEDIVPLLVNLFQPLNIYPSLWIDSILYVSS